MTRQFRKLPSEILSIENDYAAYCFNEAINVTMMKLNEGKTPVFERENNKDNPGLKLLME